MTTGNTTLLKLALPVDGELDGTWGNVVNTSITELLDTAVAGTTTLSADADVTLSDTALVSNQSRQAILLWTAGGSVLRTITAPARSKSYIVINATSGSQSIKLVGAGPTTGITVVAGERCLAAWNGSDFVKVATSVPDGVTSVSGTGTVQGLTLSGTVTSTGSLTLGGSLSAINLASQVTGVLPVANGGTGLSSTPVNGALDIGNGTGFTRTTLTAGSGVTINNTAGGITISATGSGGTITSVTASSPLASSGGINPNISFTGILAVANGGTGASDAGTARSNLSVPSTTGSGASGTWGISVTGNAANVTGIVGVANGGTGASDASTARSNLSVPSTTGSGASGTWGINITGNAGSVTNGVYNNGGTYGINITGNANYANSAGSANYANSAGSALPPLGAAEVGTYMLGDASGIGAIGSTTSTIFVYTADNNLVSYGGTWRFLGNDINTLFKLFLRIA